MPSSDPEAWFRGFREGMDQVGRDDSAGRPASSLDRYELGERIGSGGAADVFRARDRELGREVAVKILHASLGSSTLVRDRFQREAKITAGLSHPGVLTIHDAGEAGGRLYLVMELVDGRPLGELLAERSYDIKAMVQLLEKVSRGVAAAHERGIVHRDLKPGNILVGRTGEPKVADFGLAHIAGAETALTRQGTVMGTPLYMAPEQVRGQISEIGPRTDVYALGAILYEILTGRPPHVGESVTEIYGRIVNEDPFAPRRLNARASAELETIALKALEKDPARRYADGGAFADDLRRYLDGDPILAAPPGSVTVAVKWARRHRTTTAVSAVILLAAAVLVAGAVKRRIDRTRQIAGLVEEGRKARGDCDALLGELAGLRTEERKRTEELDLDPSEEGRRPLWELQNRIDGMQKKADTLYDDSLTAFTSAYALDPADAGPRKELAAHYYREYQRSEQEADERAKERSRRSLEMYDDGAIRREINHETPLRVDSRPSGAEVELLKYEQGPDRRLMERSVRILGPGPVTVELKAGPWLLILRKDGYREVRHSFFLERGRDGPLTVDLYREEEIGADFVYVPGGPFTSGGDPRVRDPQERKILDLGGFFIGRCEITYREYYEFLNSLLDEGKRDEVQRRHPRPGIEAALNQRIAPGTVRIEFSEDIPPDAPIDYISWDDASAYVLWRTGESARSGRNEVFRLPTEDEWEKAARGGDGRSFPWGNHFDYSFANLWRGAQSKNNRVRAGAWEKDCSPYGVLDMGAGLNEFCAGLFDRQERFRPTRGGNVSARTPDYFRIAFRNGVRNDYPAGIRGFRLVKELPRR